MNYLKLLFIAVLIYNLTGCTTTKTSLQNIEVDGTIVNLPIRITENKTAGTFELHFNYLKNNTPTLNTNVEGHSKVNNNGLFIVESVPNETYYIERSGVNTNEYIGDNLRWNTPEYAVSGDLDLAISNSFVFTGGFNYSKINNKDYWSQNVALGFYNEKETWATRFDIGFIFQEIYYKADYAEIEDINLNNHQTRKVYFYTQDKKDNYVTPYISFTLNSRRADWPINCFFNYTIGWQTIFNFEPEYHSFSDLGSFELSSTAHSFSAGLHKSFDDFGRLVGGVRYIKYTEDNGNLNLFNIFVQFDFLISNMMK
ncbi:MAG: hypothetical protein V1773_06205 [bacterium]